MSMEMAVLKTEDVEVKIVFNKKKQEQVRMNERQIFKLM